jgi:hypothetical protein
VTKVQLIGRYEAVRRRLLETTHGLQCVAAYSSKDVSRFKDPNSPLDHLFIGQRRQERLRACWIDDPVHRDRQAQSTRRVGSVLGVQMHVDYRKGTRLRRCLKGQEKEQHGSGKPHHDSLRVGGARVVTRHNVVWAVWRHSLVLASLWSQRLPRQRVQMGSFYWRCLRRQQPLARAFGQIRALDPELALAS